MDTRAKVGSGAPSDATGNLDISFDQDNLVAALPRYAFASWREISLSDPVRAERSLQRRRHYRQGVSSNAKSDGGCPNQMTVYMNLQLFRGRDF
jgi:hypothetical protein